MSFIPDTQFLSGLQTERPQPHNNNNNTVASDAEPLVGSPCVIDMKEDDQCISLSMEMPGVLGKDIIVNIQRGILTIKGFRCVRDMDGRVVKRQRLCRRFSVDTDVVDIARASANVWNGVLNLYAPKKSRPFSVNIPVTEMPDCAFSAEVFGRRAGNGADAQDGPCRIPDDMNGAAVH